MHRKLLSLVCWTLLKWFRSEKRSSDGARGSPFLDPTRAHPESVWCFHLKTEIHYDTLDYWMIHGLLMINGFVMGNYCLTLRCQTCLAGKYTRFVSFGEAFLLKAPHRSRGFPATGLDPTSTSWSHDAWKRTHQSAALTNIWLVVYLATPLKIMEFGPVGMMKFPIYIYIYIYMENKNHVPNHQPVDVYHCGSISFINPRYAGVYQKQRMVFTCFGPVFQIQTEAQGVDKHIYIYIYLVYLDPPSTHYQNGMFHDVYPIMLVLLLITSFMGAWRV